MASLVLSIVAILIAAAGVAYSALARREAHRSADAAECAARIDAERRHDEQAPRFDLELVDAPSGTLGLQLRNRGPIDLATVTIELVDGAGAISDLLTGDAGKESDSATLQTLRVGEAATVYGRKTPEESGGLVVLRLTCHGVDRARPWTLTKSLEVPGTPQVW